MEMIKKEKAKLNVIVRFSSEPENPKDLADLFILLNEMNEQQKNKNTQINLALA